jgi:predicted ArsR family transcriptional regulator
VLACVRDHPGQDSFDIAKRLAIDETTIRDAMGELLRRGLVVRHGQQKKPIKRYLTEKVELTLPTYYPA